MSMGIGLFGVGFTDMDDVVARWDSLSEPMRLEMERLFLDRLAEEMDGGAIRTWRALEARFLAHVFTSRHLPATWAVARLSYRGTSLMLLLAKRPRPVGPNIVDLTTLKGES